MQAKRGLFLRMTDVRSDEAAFPEDYTYERRSSTGFAETVQAVRAAIAQRDLTVRRAYDIQAALLSKGFPIQPLTILEVGRSDDEGLADLVGLLTPLRFNVYQRGEEVYVSALRPSFVNRLVHDDEVDRLTRGLESDVLAVVDAAAAS